MVKLKFRSSIRYMRIILLVVTYIYLEISSWFEPGPKDQVEVSPGGLVQDGIAIRIVWTGPSSAKSIFLALRPALPPLSPPSSRSSSPPIQVAGASETESASAPPPCSVVDLLVDPLPFFLSFLFYLCSISGCIAGFSLTRV